MNIDKIAEDYYSNKITIEEANNQLTDAIYKNKKDFYLDTIDEDTLHDFLLYMYDRFIKIFESYNKERGSFKAFFCASLYTSRRAFLRKHAEEKIQEKILNDFFHQDYEEIAYKYESERAEKAVEVQCAIEEVKDFSQSIQNANKTKDSYLTNCFHKKYYHSKAESKNDDLRKIACLLLFLKSCLFYSDDITKKVSLITGISEEKLNEMGDKLKEKAWIRKLRKDIDIKQRDNAFYFRQKLKKELCYFENEDIIRKKKRLYESHTKSWKKKLEFLERTDHTAAPSNKEIGDILCIPERKVSYILKKAREKIDAISI